MRPTALVCKHTWKDLKPIRVAAECFLSSTTQPGMKNSEKCLQKEWNCRQNTFCFTDKTSYEHLTYGGLYVCPLNLISKALQGLIL